MFWERANHLKVPIEIIEVLVGALEGVLVNRGCLIEKGYLSAAPITHGIYQLLQILR